MSSFVFLLEIKEGTQDGRLQSQEIIVLDSLMVHYFDAEEKKERNRKKEK